VIREVVVNPGYEDISVSAIIQILWRGKWLILGTVVVVVSLGFAYCLYARPAFTASVAILPASSGDMSSRLARLSGVAGLLGVDLGAGSSTQQPFAVLRSADLARQFIQKHDLTAQFARDPGATKVPGTGQSPARDSQFALESAVTAFRENVLSFTEDRKTGVTKVGVTWKDPAIAAGWANDYVGLANERLRLERLAETDANIDYLRRELAATTMPAIQQALGRVLESEMQTALLARAKKDFAFTIVDSAVPPLYRSSPKRRIILLACFLAGGALSVLYVLARATLLPSVMKGAPRP
jgi:uncharacterized protein involved in exopolysaccharide biosynthesis